MNNSKNRKSDAQKTFEEADNAGRFSGDDADAKAARRQAEENIRQDTSRANERNDRDYNDSDAHRDPAQTHDMKGESQNVNDDSGRPLTPGELKKARNKAQAK